MSEAETSNEIVVSSATTGSRIKRLKIYIFRVLHIHPFKRTLIYLFKRPMTEMYHPLLEDTKSELTITPAFRGFLALNMENCIGCQACMKICPNKVITMVTRAPTDPGQKAKRYPSYFAGRCMFCALCAEACRFESLYLSNDFEDAPYTRENLWYTPERMNEVYDKYLSPIQKYDFETWLKKKAEETAEA